MLSHALALILDVCPHNPTLLRILLDVTLDHGFVNESNTLLRELLSLSLSSSGGPPPVSHPAHCGFLADLRSRWKLAVSCFPACISISSSYVVFRAFWRSIL